MRNAYHEIIESLAICVICVALLCQGCSKQEAPSYSGPPSKMVIGVPKVENAALLYTADHLGYFRQLGIDAELREFDSGVAAVAALNEGRVDLATAADFAFASNILKHPKLRMVAAINSANNNYMVARRDRGIRNPADLKGKRIAVTRTSIGEYFLGKYLSSNRIRLDEVTIVNMTPTVMEKEIVTGSIDAALFWGTVAWRMKENLGTNAVSWPAQGESPYHMVLIGRDGFIKKESAALVRLMKALIMAEKSIEKDPAAVQRYISRRLGMPEKYCADVWGDNRFKVSLERSLMLTLEEESRWIQSTQGSTQRVPNYLLYIYFDALESARSESVTIIH